MVVVKFGGTSVSTKENLENIFRILKAKKEAFIAVFSALSGMTNLLEQIATTAQSQDCDSLIDRFKQRHYQLIEEVFPSDLQSQQKSFIQSKCDQLSQLCTSIQILDELSDKSKAKIASYGEDLSSYLIHNYLTYNGLHTNYIDSKSLIKANGSHLSAQVDMDTTNQNIRSLDTKKNYIAGGFIASNHKGEIVTLGRGGSDYTAAIYAGAIRASQLELWSDIDGMHSANPQKVHDTQSIKEMSYQEAFELAYFGAKVLYPPTISPLVKNNIPLYLKNTKKPDELGTKISNTTNDVSKNKIKGITALSGISVITVSGTGLARKKGSARRVFQALEEQEINVILITQSCSEHSIGIGISTHDVDKAIHSLHNQFELDIQKDQINPVVVNDQQSIIAIVGDQMKNSTGLSGKIFSALGENGINVTAIAQGASERNISIVIDEKNENKALNVLHERLFLDAIKDIHLCIVGVGNVGKEFLNIINTQKEILRTENKLNLKVVGIANSKKMLYKKDGLSSSQLLQKLNESGTKYDSLEEMVTQLSKDNLRNTIFVDNSASPKVSELYHSILSKNMSLVTCNKIACSGPQDYYQSLKKEAKEKNIQFKYETTVGAALPIIKTIQDLIISGDKIKRIQAVMSGSLNFIFNAYDGSRSFADIVRLAQKEGYTEPNPWIDLSGLDVMRKILILARESGYRREIDDIRFQSFMPSKCEQAQNTEQLYEYIEAEEEFFSSLYQKAKNNGNKLKVIATMDEGQLSVSLEEVSPDSPLYNLEGKDNGVAIHTERYHQEPLVIKGAGAGAMVTASGVFADLIAIVNQ